MIGAGRPLASAKCSAKRSGVDGRRGDDQLEVRPLGQQPLEVAEQEVHVQAALVGLVDDQGVVALEHPVALQLGEQDAVGHHLHAALLRRTVGEPHLVADGLPQLAAELLGDPLGDAAGRDPARLGVPDHRRHRQRRSRRDRVQGRSWAAGWSFPTRSPRRRSRPGGRGSPLRCRRDVPRPAGRQESGCAQRCHSPYWLLPVPPGDTLMTLSDQSRATRTTLAWRGCAPTDR